MIHNENKKPLFPFDMPSGGAYTSTTPIVRMKKLKNIMNIREITQKDFLLPFLKIIERRIINIVTIGYEDGIYSIFPRMIFFV